MPNPRVRSIRAVRHAGRRRVHSLCTPERDAMRQSESMQVERHVFGGRMQHARRNRRSVQCIGRAMRIDDMRAGAGRLRRPAECVAMHGTPGRLVFHSLLRRVRRLRVCQSFVQR